MRENRSRIVSSSPEDEEGHTETLRVFHFARSGRIESRERFIPALLNARSSAVVSSNTSWLHFDSFYAQHNVNTVCERPKINVMIPPWRNRISSSLPWNFCNNNLNFFLEKGCHFYLVFFPVQLFAQIQANARKKRRRSQNSEIRRKQILVDPSRLARFSRNRYWRRASRVSMCVRVCVSRIPRKIQNGNKRATGQRDTTWHIGVFAKG